MAYCSPTDQLSYLDTPEFYYIALHFLGFIAIPLHLFGAYCIMFKTPSSMSSVKPSMLNYHFWTFIVDLVFSILVCPYFIFPVFGIVPLGILQQLGISVPIQMYITLTAAVFLFFSGVLILENRYVIITNSNKTWRRLRVPWLIGMGIYAVLVFLPVYLNIPEDQKSAKQVAYEKLPCLLPEIRSAALFIIAEDFLVTYFSGMAMQLIVLMHSLIFTGYTHWTLKKESSRLSNKTLKLQKQFLRAVYIQMAVPVFTLQAPLTFIGIDNLFKNRCEEVVD
ncbi:hypothetical protein GCK72_019593 [Caenorhabditis remanei]|uniref:G protein-coupled receptor n=1 Tax=Caenorhabditis remanei TaxID=31234 RepID=A0A6A5GCQ1_CAERE|nr:hypothetical protein GCK72_019593 [Caenorhabditis remanei]KAF1753037.1 hypothetical protein GCK72_019593 [Caenorhabditis remanei]